MRYKEGNRVRVRQWEAMLRGNKLVCDGINFLGKPFLFLKTNRRFCGQVVTIKASLMTIIVLKKIIDNAVGLMKCLRDMPLNLERLLSSAITVKIGKEEFMWVILMEASILI